MSYESVACSGRRLQMTGPLFDIAVTVARIAVFFAFCFGWSS